MSGHSGEKKKPTQAGKKWNCCSINLTMSFTGPQIDFTGGIRKSLALWAVESLKKAQSANSRFYWAILMGAERKNGRGDSGG